MPRPQMPRLQTPGIVLDGNTRRTNRRKIIDVVLGTAAPAYVAFSGEAGGAAGLLSGVK